MRATPLCALAAMIGGAAVLLWYRNLTTLEQQQADGLAAVYALNLFGKTLDELSDGEAAQIHYHTRQHFN